MVGKESERADSNFQLVFNAKQDSKDWFSQPQIVRQRARFVGYHSYEVEIGGRGVVVPQQPKAIVSGWVGRFGEMGHRSAPSSNVSQALERPRAPMFWEQMLGRPENGRPYGGTTARSAQQSRNSGKDD